MAKMITSGGDANREGEAFLREVDDEFRRDRMGQAWQRYGRLAIVGVAILLIAVAAGLYWRKWRADQADARATVYSQALAQMRSGQSAKAAPALAALSTAREPGYRALALLEQAGALAQTDPVKAAAQFGAIAANADVAKPFRDLATLKGTALAFDKLAPGAVIARLSLLAQPGTPWFGTAGELTALAYLREGKPDQARVLLNAITKDTSVPQSIRGRAAQLAAGIAPTAPGAPAR